jgi:hypothetical protein
LLRGYKSSVISDDYSTGSVSFSYSPPSKVDSYFADLKANVFVNQTKSFWANIISAYKHSVQGGKDPSIILLVSDDNTKTTNEHFAKHLLLGLSKNEFYKPNNKQHDIDRQDLSFDPTNQEINHLINNKKSDKVFFKF